MWYQDGIYLVYHRMVKPFQFGETGGKKLKNHKTIEQKQWKVLEKEGRKTIIFTSDAR